MFSSFKIQIVDLRDLSPCKIFLINSNIMFSVSRYLIVKFPFLDWSVREKYLMFKCLVL